MGASNSEWILNNVASDDITFIELENKHHVATLDYDAELIFAESAAFIGGWRPQQPDGATARRASTGSGAADRPVT